MALGRVGHHVPDLLLGVVAAVHAAVEFRTPGAHLGKEGILLDLYAPALVVCEVPVHYVHLVLAEEVYLLLDVFYGDEVAARVYVEAAPGEPRVVLYLQAGHGAVCLDKLLERLLCVEDAGLVGRKHPDALGRYGKGVAFGRYAGIGVDGVLDVVPGLGDVKKAFAHLYRDGLGNYIDHH